MFTLIYLNSVLKANYVVRVRGELVHWSIVRWLRADHFTIIQHKQRPKQYQCISWRYYISIPHLALQLPPLLG